MIDVQKVNNACDENIEYILTTLGIDYRYESGWISIQCPFHQGDDYNCKYRDKSWYCFSQCQRAYSTIDIVMKVLDLTFVQATEWLCNALSISDSKVSKDKDVIGIRGRLSRLKSMKLSRSAIEYKQVDQTILNSIERYNHPYLLKQGFKADTLEHFNIGFARYGDLINRVVFTIDAPNGTIISLSGRLPNASELGLPKYKIIEGSKKSTTLYNISRIDPSDDYVIVVEGFKSVMSLYEWGFKSVVATMGASLSVEQRNLLLGLGRKIIVIGDNDVAGSRLNQAVYNQCYKYANVTKVDLGEFTSIDKASPCEQDLDWDEMYELTEHLKGVIK